MSLDTWLRVGAIGLPLIGGLTIWRWGNKFPQAQRWLVVSIFGLAGLLALILFLLNRYYGCILLTGTLNCLFDFLATLSLCLLNLTLAGASIVSQGENKGNDYVLMLLLSSAWAGVGLAENLLVLLIFLYLFLFVINRWLTGKGIRGGFLKMRDDYEDDQK